MHKRRLCLGKRGRAEPANSAPKESGPRWAPRGVRPDMPKFRTKAYTNRKIR